MDSTDKKARETAKVLNNLTDFLAGNEREMEEILDSLREQDVDPAESLRQFRQILSEHAQTWQEKAAYARAILAKSFESHKVKIHRTRSQIEREIREIVESMQTMGASVEAGAYHRKFEGARDEDLESLLEDLRHQQEWLLQQRKEADENG